MGQVNVNRGDGDPRPPYDDRWDNRRPWHDRWATPISYVVWTLCAVILILVLVWAGVFLFDHVITSFR